LEELRKFLTGHFFKDALTTYQTISIPGLPTAFITNKQLGVVEQFAVASLLEGYDATGWPWTKEEKHLLSQLTTMLPPSPTDVELYQMNNIGSRLRVGALVYGWDEVTLNERYEALPIHQRKDVAVNGHDIVEMGFQGPMVDTIFLAIEEAIILRQLDNKKAVIQEWIKEKFDEH